MLSESFHGGRKRHGVERTYVDSLLLAWKSKRSSGILKGKKFSVRIRFQKPTELFELVPERQKSQPRMHENSLNTMLTQ